MIDKEKDHKDDKDEKDEKGKEDNTMDCCGIKSVADGKLQWMCRRGMLELDVLLQSFLENEYDRLTEEDKRLFRELLAEEDTMLWDWLVVAATQPPTKYVHLVEIIRQVK